MAGLTRFRTGPIHVAYSHASEDGSQWGFGQAEFNWFDGTTADMADLIRKDDDFLVDRKIIVLSWQRVGDLP